MGLWEVKVPGFEERDDSLRKIFRWSEYPFLFYRLNDLQHYRDGITFLEVVLPVAEQVYGGDFSSDLARAVMLVHDDGEIPTADVSGGAKSQFTDAQKEHFESFERASLESSVVRFNGKKIKGHEYSKLLQMAFDKDNVEANLVSLVDKFCGFGEALHELYAGNPIFKGVLGRDSQPAIRRYEQLFQRLPEKYPILEQLLKEDIPMFRQPKPIDLAESWCGAHLHTTQSVRKPTGYVHYDLWKETILAQGEEGLQRLTKVNIGIPAEERKILAYMFRDMIQADRECL